MLPRIIDRESERHFVALDRNDGFHLLFTSAAEYARNPFHPHWARTVADERTLTALARWMAFRRDRWGEWGDLAERVGIDAFADHMGAALEREPVEEVVGTVVDRLDDPCGIVVGELLRGRLGYRTETLIEHRFATARARDALMDWIHAGGNEHAAQLLVTVGFGGGADALARTLDDMAQAAVATAARQRHGRAAPRRKRA